MNVAMLADGFIGWGGGIDFLKAYVSPLLKLQDVKVFVFFPVETKFRRSLVKLRNWVYAIWGGNIISSQPLPVHDIMELLRAEGVEIVPYICNWKQKSALIKGLRQCHIDIIFPTRLNLGRNFPIPWVPYLPDFQHKYYPDFFTADECMARDKAFQELLQTAKAVIVEAEDVRKDIFKFYPDTTAKIFVMPYTAIPEPEWLDLSNVSLEKYHLPEHFFLISNQFWIHKDHMTAFKALSKLVQDGETSYDIVCTGLAKDYRDTDYLDKIMKRLKELGIEEKVHFLGYIPKQEQMKIMCSSVAVIQPTLFEGNPGGGIAYNAVSLEVPIILSDIPVNRELKAEWVRFFHAGSAEDLACAMKAMIREKENCYIPKAPEELLSLGEERMKTLKDAVHEVLEYMIPT